jgi:hypothetical protein
VSGSAKTTPGSGKGRGGLAVTEILALAHTDWLYHHLRVSGVPDQVAAFRQAAAGAGVIPWQHDFDRVAEDWFHLLVAPPAPQQRSLSLEGAQILAAQLRQAAEARQRWVAEQAPHRRACPLDLHRLIPVPGEILRLGPDHPEALAWLWQAWGTTQALRQVVELPIPKRGKPPRHDPGLFWVGFWAADWTPWRAILTLRTRWPGLRIEIRPIYDDP